VLLKYAFVILLLTALFAQSFSRSILLADYLVNIEVYKKKCINKAKPMLQCNGKCQMLKKLKKQNTGVPSDAPVPPFNQFEVVLSSKSYFPTIDFVIFSTKRKYNSISASFFTNYRVSIFHPPGVIE
jgi:hypothetical protein